MSGILQTALADALLVTAAAPIVWAISRLARRPALTHAFWLIVLVKLLTPSLWTFPIQLPRNPVPAPAVVTPAPSVDVLTTGIASDWPVSEERILVQETPARGPLPHAVSLAKPAPAPVPQAHARIGILLLLEVTWAVGAVLCLLMAITRVIRFSRLLRYARPATEQVQARADLLACRLRLGKAPRVQFIPGTLCPMLWPVGRSARLLVPQALWDRLDLVQRDTVLLHELAHWARRDHWVRWIELVATSLYWWLPACWWARRELRKAEEQCCDACVLWALPGTFHNYANALLEAVEFVSIRADRPSASIAVPALASGMGQFSDLKRRLTMLKHGNVSRALSWGGLAAAFGLGALLLPISPTIGQDAPQPAPAADAAPAARPNPTVRVDGTTPIPGNPTPSDLTSARSDEPFADEYTKELHASERRIEALTRQLQDERARIDAFKAQHDGRATTTDPARGPAAGKGFFGLTGADQPSKLDAPGAAGPTPVPVPGDASAGPVAGGSQPELRPGVPPPTAQVTPNPTTARAEPAKGRVVIVRDPSNRIMKIYTAGDGKYATASYQYVPAPGTSTTPQSERLDKLESELRLILQEIETIRAQSAAPGAPAGPGLAPIPGAPEAAQPAAPTPPAVPSPSAPETSPDALPRTR